MWAATGKQPAALREKPKLSEDDADYYEAFKSLSGARVYTEVGPQPIPVSEVLAYCEFLNITDQFERQAILRIMQAMDSAYIEHQVTKAKGRGSPSNDTGHPKTA
jgi:hypothetical protein